MTREKLTKNSVAELNPKNHTGSSLFTVPIHSSLIKQFGLHHTMQLNDGCACAIDLMPKKYMSKLVIQPSFRAVGQTWNGRH